MNKKKKDRCENRLSPLLGWDIHDLRDKKVKGGTGSCGGTATVQGKCYDQSAINYYLWGLGCKYCGDTEEDAVERVHKYKTIRGGDWYAIQQAYGFTKAGYRGLINFDVPELVNFSHSKCKRNLDPSNISFNYRFGDISIYEFINAFISPSYPIPPYYGY